MDTKQVLLLNSREQVLSVITWKKAVKLLLLGKAIKPHSKYTKSYVIKTTKGKVIIPAAIVLLRFYELPDQELPPTRANIMKRDQYTCQYCGFKSKNSKSLTLDHVHPKCRGGDSGWTNMVTACKECNKKKSNMLLKDCGLNLRRKPYKPKYYALYLTGLSEEGKELWSQWIIPEEIHRWKTPNQE